MKTATHVKSFPIEKWIICTQR